MFRSAQPTEAQPSVRSVRQVPVGCTVGSYTLQGEKGPRGFAWNQTPDSRLSVGGPGESARLLIRFARRFSPKVQGIPAPGRFPFFPFGGVSRRRNRGKSDLFFEAEGAWNRFKSSRNPAASIAHSNEPWTRVAQVSAKSSNPVPLCLLHGFEVCARAEFSENRPEGRTRSPVY